MVTRTYLAPVNDSSCLQCGRSNWHNAWLCIECGYPNEKTWREYVRAGYIHPRTKEGKDRAAWMM